SQRSFPPLPLACASTHASARHPLSLHDALPILQASLLRFHNRMVDVLGSDNFDEVQKMVRFHYQWVVLHDFLPTIVGLDTLKSIFGTAKDGTVDYTQEPKLKFY